MKNKLVVTIASIALFISSNLSMAAQNEIEPANNPAWQEECGACHFAYQPGLLPPASWDKLLTAQTLHDHFGEVADLEPDALKEIRDYALTHAADKSTFKRSRKIVAATENIDAPLRITEVSYIKRKHHKIPDKMIKGNKDVRSLSNCDACHTKAKEGDYDEDTVVIPNYRRD